MTNDTITMNPFLVNSEFALQVVSVSTTTRQSAGYVEEEHTVRRMQEVQKKISIYKTGNSAQYTAFLFSINKFARDIYLYIQANLGENQDTIILDMEKICAVSDMGKDSYYKGIDDLRSNAFITVCKKNRYWINPFILFRGDRIAYYREQCPECIQNVSHVYREKTTSTHNKSDATV